MNMIDAYDQGNADPPIHPASLVKCPTPFKKKKIPHAIAVFILALLELWAHRMICLNVRKVCPLTQRMLCSVSGLVRISL